MTESEIIAMIASGIPKEQQAQAEDRAKGFLAGAITIVGRMDGADWNMDHVKFNLTSGKSSYSLNVDVLSSHEKIAMVSDLYYTDREDFPIKIIRKAEFDAVARGVSGSGRPHVGTVYQKRGQTILEIARTPDSGYEVEGTVKLAIDSFSQIPSQYHDLLVTTAYKLIAASQNPSVAMAVAAEGASDARTTGTKWTGTHIMVDRGIDTGSTRKTRVDSGNLRP